MHIRPAPPSGNVEHFPFCVFSPSRVKYSGRTMCGLVVGGELRLAKKRKVKMKLEGREARDTTEYVA